MRSSRGEPIFHGGAESLSHQRRLQVLDQGFIQSFGNRTTWDCVTPIRHKFEQNGGIGDLKWMSYLDLNFRLAELLLMRVDKMSMAVSLEARVPFLDHEFVQLALSIDEKLLTKNGTLKHMLKKAVRGLIHDDLIDRKTQGFGLPLKDWIMQDLEDDLYDSVREFADQTGIIRKSLSRKEFKAFQPSHQWTLANLAMWWDRMVRN
jgi:asparagine synthase (glutamine-hydrolysing)